MLCYQSAFEGWDWAKGYLLKGTFLFFKFYGKLNSPLLYQPQNPFLWCLSHSAFISSPSPFVPLHPPPPQLSWRLPPVVLPLPLFPAVPTLDRWPHGAPVSHGWLRPHRCVPTRPFLSRAQWHGPLLSTWCRPAGCCPSSVLSPLLSSSSSSLHFNNLFFLLSALCNNFWSALAHTKKLCCHVSF